MLKIALVDDDAAIETQLKGFLKRYEQETGETFQVTSYSTAVTFLTNYKPVFDIVFMDIEMPELNGMDASFKLREIDKSVILVFLTNMAQYAVKGYEVDAFYYVVKPVAYYDFSLKLRRVIERSKMNQDRNIDFYMTDGGYVRLQLSQIQFVEVMNHNIVFHENGKMYKKYGTLKDTEKLIADERFVRCHSSFLVNLRHVTEVKKDTVTVGSHILKISYNKKAEFMSALNNYHAGGGTK